MSDKNIEEMDAIELIIAAEAAGSTGLDMSPGDPLAAACARMMKALVRDIWRKDQGPSFWFTVVWYTENPAVEGRPIVQVRAISLRAFHDDKPRPAITAQVQNIETGEVFDTFPDLLFKAKEGAEARKRMFAIAGEIFAKKVDDQFMEVDPWHAK